MIRTIIEQILESEGFTNEMRKKFARSGRKSATNEEINHASDAFYKNDGKW